MPAHLEVEAHALRPDACAHCGSAALDAADELVEEKLHVVKEHPRRRVVRRTTCRCRECGGRTTPRSLPAPYERSKVTSEWLAWFVHGKFTLLTPLDRIRRDLAERGISLAMGTLVSFIERAADLLAPIDGWHWKQLLAGSWLATDGTGIKVLIPKLPAAHNGYLELYRNDELAVFQYAADKSGEDVVNKLRSFRHRDALLRFLEDPRVPIDNSPTEREFQNVAKLRLNMLFAGSTEVERAGRRIENFGHRSLLFVKSSRPLPFAYDHPMAGPAFCARGLDGAW